MFEIEQRFDEPELSQECRMLAGLIRHVFGDPFQPTTDEESARPYFGSVESLRRIALGLFGYEERNGGWPRYAICDSAGKRLLSW